MLLLVQAVTMQMVHHLFFLRLQRLVAQVATRVSWVQMVVVAAVAVLTQQTQVGQAQLIKVLQAVLVQVQRHIEAAVVVAQARLALQVQHQATAVQA